MTMQFVVGATPDTDRSTARHRQPAYARRAAFTTRTSAPFGPSATRRWKTRRPHRLYASTGSTRRTICCATYGFAADEVVYGPTATFRSPSIPRAPGRCPIPSGFRSRSPRHRPRSCCGCPASDRVAARPYRRRSERATSFAGSPISRRLGVVTIARGGFLTLRGRRLQTARWTEQLGFWAPEDEVGTHHVVYQVSPGTFR